VLAIIDGDILAYNACKPRWQKHARAVSSGTSVKRLDEDGHVIPLEWTQEQDMEYLMECWGNFQRDLEKLVNRAYCDDYVMAVKGERNYRHILYPEYKLHRARNTNELVRFVPSVRKRAVLNGLAVSAEGREADDLMRIWANECKKHKIDYVICSIDKDLRMIPGRYFNINKETSEDIDEFTALQIYYAQIISGDPTDNIPGIPGMGPKKSHAHICECLTEEEMQEAVVGAYIEFYGEGWFDYLLLNAKLIHLQNHPNDYFTMRHWPIVKELL
jgi:5'-3' exonuclease